MDRLGSLLYLPHVSPIARDQIFSLPANEREIERVYSRLVTRFDRNPRSPAGSQRLPVMILFSDLPVYKREKQSIKDVSINDGLHYGGIVLTPPVSRFQGTLDAHFKEEQDKYVNDKLTRIHVKPIIWNAAYVDGLCREDF